MKIWSTKRCLVAGIQLYEAKTAAYGGVMVKSEIGLIYLPPKDWHDNFESAQRRAEEIQRREIESLKRRIKKIKQIEFT